MLYNHIYLVGYGWNHINYLHPASTSLSLSTWLISVEYHHFLHSYVDLQSTIISDVDMLIFLGLISPMNCLDFLYIMISTQALAYYIDGWISHIALVFRPNWWWESKIEYVFVIISHCWLLTSTSWFILVNRAVGWEVAIYYCWLQYGWKWRCSTKYWCWGG